MYGRSENPEAEVNLRSLGFSNIGRIFREHTYTMPDFLHSHGPADNAEGVEYSTIGNIHRIGYGRMYF